MASCNSADEVVARAAAAATAAAEASSTEVLLCIKEEGNTAFRKGDYSTAATKYSHMITRLAIKRDPAPGDTQLQLAANLNLAQCHLKLGDAELAIERCDASLALDAKSVKGRGRRGHALTLLGRFKEVQFRNTYINTPD